MSAAEPNLSAKRWTRPPVSMSFWVPVKNGWHLLQMSIFSSLLVERVVKTLPQVHLTVHSTYSG